MKYGDELSGGLQDNVFTGLLFSDTAAAAIRGIVDPSLFTSRPYRDVVARAYAYFDQYKKAPKDHIADEVEDLIKQEGEHAALIADAISRAKELSEDLNEAYVLDSLSRFLRQQSLKLGIIQAHEHVVRGDLESAEVVLAKAAKVRSSVFSPGLDLASAAKLLSSPEEAREALNLGIPELDRLKLGPAKQELHLLMAPPKRGKSWWLIHCAKRGILQRWRGVYITLELSEKLVARRMLQSLFSGTTREDVDTRYVVFDKERTDAGTVRIRGIEQRAPRKVRNLASPENFLPLVEEVRRMYLEHRLLIKEFPTGSLTVNGLSAYLDQLDSQHHFVPDFLVLDYADLMKVDSNNYRIELGNLYKDLRGLAGERHLALITASQSNREGAKSRLLTDIHAAEDYSKIATADCVLTYSQTSLEKQLKLARLFVASGRLEADRFTVNISQDYGRGQFVCDSGSIPDSQYWSMLPSGEEDAAREEGGA